MFTAKNSKHTAIIVAFISAFAFCFLYGISEANVEFSGFTVTDTGTVDIIGAKTVLYTHDKTGARVMHIANDDTERALRVTFETPALDNKGIPHVFEHICASGSQNYPSPNLFLSAIYQTYNTNMNATTFNSMTSYQYATMSEAQLLLIADYYLDSVFYPLLYTDELTFQRESWRYELTDADAPLGVNGIVYNEMRGAMTIERTANHNMLNTLFPGSSTANNSGGIPEDILTMTYEDCVNFHQAYYHPSNAFIFLYGDLDVEPFLELMGSYFDKFDRKDIVIERDDVKPAADPATAVFEFPVEINSEVENNSVIHYAFNLGRLSSVEYASFEILSTVLANDSSPIMRKLRETLPGASTAVRFSPAAAGSFVAVSAMGVNEEDKDTLKAVVDEAIAEIMQIGFDKELLEAAIASNEFYVLSMAESSGLGLRITAVMAWLNSLGFGFNNWNEYLDAIEIAKADYAYGYFEAMVEKLIADNPHNVLVVTVPAPGLREYLDERLREELDAVKAGMSDEEIARIIEVNEELAVMAEAPAPAELLGRLTGVTVETLPIEIKTYDISEMSLDGITAYTAKAAVSGLNITSVDYNSAAITLEDLHYLNLYADLLGEVQTENLDLTTLQTRMTRFLFNFGVTAGFREFYDYSHKPILNVQWYSINDDYAEAAALVREIITGTDLTDAERISGVIGRLITSARSAINNRPGAIMFTRAKALSFDSFALVAYISGIAYHQFLSEAQIFLENDPEGFAVKLREVRDKLIFKEDAVVMFAGNAEGMEIFKENAGILFEHLTEEPLPAADLQLIPRPSRKEGVVIEASVQYNLIFASHDEIGLVFSGKLLPLMDIISDAYLTPTVRYTIGAYGCQALADRHGVVFISSRDPAVAETFAAYEGAADFASDHGLTQEDINRYIISAFSSQTVPEGELRGALSAMRRKYLGFPDDYRLNILMGIKSVTTDDLTDFSKRLALTMDKGVRSTAGGESAILENAELFESIVYPFGVPQAEDADNGNFLRAY